VSAASSKPATSQNSSGRPDLWRGLALLPPVNPVPMPAISPAKGLLFMTLEDETGNSNVIITPDFHEKNRVKVLYERFVQISGTVQNQDGIVHLKAKAISPLAVSSAEILSHDFH
jgi:OB-fold nucleic acid binding protein